MQRFCQFSSLHHDLFCAWNASLSRPPLVLLQEARQDAAGAWPRRRGPGSLLRVMRLSVHALLRATSTATGFATESKTSDSDRAASSISCRICESASDLTRNESFTSERPGRNRFQAEEPIEIDVTFEVDLQGVDVEPTRRGLGCERPGHTGAQPRQKRFDGSRSGVVAEELGRMVTTHPEPSLRHLAKLFDLPRAHGECESAVPTHMAALGQLTGFGLLLHTFNRLAHGPYIPAILLAWFRSSLWRGQTFHDDHAIMVLVTARGPKC